LTTTQKDAMSCIVLIYFYSMRKLGFSLIWVIFISWNAHAQKNVRDSVLNIHAIGGHFGFHLPMVDLGQRFGFGQTAGGSYFFKSKSNFTLEANYTAFFGNRVKEDTIFDNITTSQGYLLNVEGQVTDVVLFQRGFNVGVRVGKIFPIIGPNQNSGLHLQFGAGLMQHKIKIETYFERVPQLEDEYIKGYDKLSNGLLLMQGVGYQHFSDKRLINYYIGLEVTQGFTKNRRSVDFNPGIANHSPRLDLMTAVVFKWYFPLYKRKPDDYYFY
jgi:hypothetical protein